MAVFKLSQGVPTSISAQIKGWFSKNILLKIAALALAVFIWFDSAMNRIHQQDYRIPILVTVADTTLVDTVGDHGSARVLLEGEGKDFLKLLLRKPIAHFTVTEREPRKIEFPLSPQDVVMPEGMDLRAVSVLEPRTIEIELDRFMRRVLPVSPVIEPGGKGFLQESSILVEPPEVPVAGARSELKGLTSIPTMPVALPSTSGEYVVEADLDLSGFVTLTTSVKRVKVKGTVERVIEKKLEDIRVEVTGSLASGYRAKPETIDLIITGIESTVMHLSSAEVRAVLEVNDPPAVETYYSPRITLPENVELISEQPKLFQAVPRDSLAEHEVQR
jgi:hypothetical protein